MRSAAKEPSLTGVQVLEAIGRQGANTPLNRCGASAFPMRNLNRPFGTIPASTAHPTLKTLGYYHMSLRDRPRGCVHALERRHTNRRSGLTCACIQDPDQIGAILRILDRRLQSRARSAQP